ncbi:MULTISPECIES: hypothetical protein [Methylobacteriaceae]|nr:MULTISPECIES: hypothetical protein [Methylobacteriaceae]GEL42852.1 hypothetical protein MEX01_34430 [Methylorubrum extorquens]
MVALLVRLSDNHDEDAGKWLLEAEFRCDCGEPAALFDDLDQAQAWFARR